MWTTKTVLSLALCFLENLLFGGTIMGWPSLAYVYRDQGLFACNNDQIIQSGNSTASCPDQDRFLPLGMTMGLVGIGLGGLGIGWILDKYGLRITRTVTIVIGVTGSLCLAFANRNHAYLIFPGMFLTGTANISMIVTNNHVALLAGKRAPMFNLLNSGAINSAGIIYFLIKLAYDHGFSQQWSLLILSSMWIIVALTTFLLLPRFKIQPSREANETGIQGDNAQLGGKHTNTEAEVDQSILTPGNSQGLEKSQQSLPVKSLWYYMLSFGFINHVVYTSLVHVWIGLVLGIMNPWLMSIYQGDRAQVSHYTNIYAYAMISCGFVLSPIAGALTDVMTRLLEGQLCGILATPARAMVTVPGLIVSSMAGILVAVFMLLQESWSVYPVFLFMEVARAFLYGNAVAYIMLVFPMEHFGMLHGVVYAVTAVTLPAQYGCVRWVEAAGYIPMVSFQLVMVMLSLLHPGIITVRYLRKRRPIIIKSTRI